MYISKWVTCVLMENSCTVILFNSGLAKACIKIHVDIGHKLLPIHIVIIYNKQFSKACDLDIDFSVPLDSCNYHLTDLESA